MTWDLTVAEELEFENWPEEQKQLAIKVLGNINEEYAKHSYNEGYVDGLNQGKENAKVPLSKHAQERVDCDLRMLLHAFMAGASPRAMSPAARETEFRSFLYKVHPDLEPYLTGEKFYQWTHEFHTGNHHAES